MQLIEAHVRALFVNHKAIFFTHDGLIVDCNHHSPLVPFNVYKELGISIETSYLDNNILIIQGEAPRSLTDQIFNNHFRLYSVKVFLNETCKETQQQILRGIHWLTWNSRMKYCSQCGGKLELVPASLEKKCRLCDRSFYPNLSPAVMVLIQRDDEILLARSAYFKPGLYSAIAGFVDIGETAELAVHREVQEEVGIQISDLEYFGTQSWPFPNSFMVAFKAQWLQGDIKIDQQEIEDARWFKIKNLPELPPAFSIARRLIESF